MFEGEIKRFERRIYLASPYIHNEERKYVQEAFDTNWMSTVGANLTELEKYVNEYMSAGGAAPCFSLALGSGTAAIHLALKLARLEYGEKLEVIYSQLKRSELHDDKNIVICQDVTFSATANPIVYEGLTPVFADSEYETWNMSPAALEKALKKYDGRVAAVIVANLYGTPAKLGEIGDLCRKYDVVLIEDAAESLSATYKGRQTGTFGKYNAISFNGNKIITATSGGMLISEDAEAVSKARFWSTQARDNAPWYQHSELGYNYRMSNLLAGVARGQMLHLEEHKAGKKAIYERYAKGLSGLPLMMNPYLTCSEPNFWLSCILLDRDAMERGAVTPEKIRLTLEDYNIESRPIWKPMHMQPIYKDCDFVAEACSSEGISDAKCAGEDIFARGLCLPSDLNMTEEQQEAVIEIIKRCFGA